MCMAALQGLFRAIRQTQEWCTYTRVHSYTPLWHALQNGSLDDALHGRQPKLAAAPVRLDWVSRTKIAAEAASALTHLHSLGPRGLAHSGLRPACILLDRDCSARLGDTAIHAIFSQPEVPPQTPFTELCYDSVLLNHVIASSALATLRSMP